MGTVQTLQVNLQLVFMKLLVTGSEQPISPYSPHCPGSWSRHTAGEGSELGGGNCGALGGEAVGMLREGEEVCGIVEF